MDKDYVIRYVLVSFSSFASRSKYLQLKIVAFVSSNFLKMIGIKICIIIVFLTALVHHGLSRKDFCPEVPPLKHFNIFEILGPWFVVQYYSSSEEAMTYTCMRTEFGLSNGNMDMKMRLTYKYDADPNEEVQTGNITWQIPNPMRPEHWRHTEDHYKGVYNTDVIDTDHVSWLILLHCSDPESEKNFLSTFILSRTPYMDRMTMDYLRQKVGSYDVDLDYLFPVNQTWCFGEGEYPHPDFNEATSTTTPVALEGDTDQDLYFAEDSSINVNNEPEELSETIEDGQDFRISPD